MDSNCELHRHERLLGLNQHHSSRGDHDAIATARPTKRTKLTTLRPLRSKLRTHLHDGCGARLVPEVQGVRQLAQIKHAFLCEQAQIACTAAQHPPGHRM
eukprot:1160573-Pelagomonas_calceolata.AAC.29